MPKPLLLECLLLGPLTAQAPGTRPTDCPVTSFFSSILVATQEKFPLPRQFLFMLLGWAGGTITWLKLLGGGRMNVFDSTSFCHVVSGWNTRIWHQFTYFGIQQTLDNKMVIRHQIYDRWAGGRIAVLGNLCRCEMTSKVFKVGIVGFPSQTTANQVL